MSKLSWGMDKYNSVLFRFKLHRKILIKYHQRQNYAFTFYYFYPLKEILLNCILKKFKKNS